MTENVSELFKAKTFKDPKLFCQSLLNLYFPDYKINNMIEIGASVSDNAKDFFNIDEYFNLDISPSEKVPTIICDCGKEFPLPSNSVDFVYSNDAFEHIERAWVTGKEITRILRPGGLVFINTLFAWRYHPVPNDYYRFTPAGLGSLFPDLKLIESGFNNAWRRDDIRGFWKSKRDSVPLDILGGWRENWKVYYFGQKSNSKNRFL